jgi:hypothetical protein
MTSHEMPRLRAALAALTADGPPVRRALVVGCGQFASAPVLRSLFPGGLLCGIDLDRAVLRIAADRRVVVADGAHLPFAPTPGFDLIVVRHPDVDRRPAGWWRVGIALGGWLAAGGHVLVSGYIHAEVEILRDSLIRAGLRSVALDQKTLPPVDLVGQDRVLLGLFQPSGGPEAGISAPARVESPES